jgi:hypothetical protein
MARSDLVKLARSCLIRLGSSRATMRPCLVLVINWQLIWTNKCLCWDTQVISPCTGTLGGDVALVHERKYLFKSDFLNVGWIDVSRAVCRSNLMWWAEMRSFCVSRSFCTADRLVLGGGPFVVEGLVFRQNSRSSVLVFFFELRTVRGLSADRPHYKYFVLRIVRCPGADRPQYKFQQMCRVSKTSFWLSFMYRGSSDLEG